MAGDKIRILVVDDDVDLTDDRARRARDAGLRGAHGQRRRARPGARLHRAPPPRAARRDDARHGRLPGLPRAAVRLHQGHPRRLPHGQDAAREHDGGEPLRRLRVHHQALPHRAPPADRAATCCATPPCTTTRSPACPRSPTCRSRCSAGSSTTASSASCTSPSTASTRSSSCRASRSSTTSSASSAAGCSDSRGQLIRGDDFVSVSSLGNAFLVVLSPARDSRPT